ncbi:MAG: hypothetical protein M3Q58_09870 [Bacteroidota bacterium]|nr:hypothetical protein [Bacteroidota bacterium]
MEILINYFSEFVHFKCIRTFLSAITEKTYLTNAFVITNFLEGYEDKTQKKPIIWYRDSIECFLKAVGLICSASVQPERKVIESKTFQYAQAFHLMVCSERKAKHGEGKEDSRSE